MKKFIVSVSMAALLAAPIFAFADHTIPHSIEQIQAEIAKIQAQLSVLRAPQSVPAIGQSAAGSAGAAIGNAGNGTAVQPYSVRSPIFDDDISDDDIVQFNNLRIQSISGAAFPVVIGASYDLGVRCRKFDSSGVSGSAEFPCPASPTILYHIRVDEDTRLLLRARQKAKITEFKIGDRINVYGFMDRGIKTIDALIMRNLDKPFREVSIQLNDVSVIGIGQAEGGAPATLTVVQKGIIRCFEFQSSVSGVTFPCPFGLEQREIPKINEQSKTSSVSVSGPPSFMPPFPSLPRKYLVEVSEQTKILNRNRESIAFGDIVVGDILNVYGLQTKELGRIRAEIVRDLSKPAQKPLEGLHVQVLWTNCPPNCQGYEAIDNAIVTVKNSDGKIIAERKTSDGVAVFDNLALGNYLVSASAAGYTEVSQKIILDQAGSFKTLNLFLSAKDANAVSVSTFSDLNGFVGKKFEATFFAKGGVAPYAWEVAKGSLPPGLVLSPTPVSVQPCAVGESYPPIIICPSQLEQNSILLHGVSTQKGNFIFILKVRDAQGNTGESSFVSVISADLEPTSPLKVISPNGGEQWQKGIIQNIKWTAPSSVSSVSISLESWYACLYALPRCAIAVRLYTLTASTQNDGIFEWTVGKDAEGNDIPAGQYIVTVSGGAFSDSSDKSFSIVAPGTIVAPTISSLQPTSGSVGMNVTIAGTGFTSINNSVNFGGDYLDGVSSNGTTITFTIPDTITPCPRISEIACLQLAKQVTPGTYAMFVTNANGTSNVINFTVTSKTGTLSINPTSAGIKVGGTTEFQALFNNCPSDAQCFVGPLPVQATWTSSNSKVAAVAYKEIPCPAGSYCLAQQFDYLTAVVTGVSLGTATITAAYTDSLGVVFTENAVVTTVMP